MRNILYIVLLLPLISFGQAVVGQNSFTVSQLAELKTRISDGAGDFISTDFGNNGFYGDGNEIYLGAQKFLNDMESGGSTSYTGAWDWFTSVTTIPDDDAGSYVQYEPTQARNSDKVGTTGAGTGSQSMDIEYVHFAGVVAAAWDGDATSITFSGQTKSKDLHALDLAREVFQHIYDQSQDSKLDWSNDTKFTPTNKYKNNPFFVSASKMAKYMETYALVQPQITGDAFYISNYAAVEQWFADAKDLFLTKTKVANKEVFGDSLPQNWDDTSVGTASDFWRGSRGLYTHYNVSGTITGDTVSWAQQEALLNQTWDLVGVVGEYGILFNDTDAKTFAYEMFKRTIQLAIFPDGTHVEWDRATTGASYQETYGAHYTHINMYHLAKIAYSHAVAVENGLTGVTDVGKYFDYTTSLGSDELWVTGTAYGGTSTSGGTKGLKMALENYALHFLTAANGGYADVRYGKAVGKPLWDGTRSYTLAAALANTYYKDSGLEDFYMLRTSANYTGPRYYADGGSPTMTDIGPYKQPSLGTAWGMSSNQGGFAGVGLMEDYVFSPAVSVTAITWADDVQSVSDIGALNLTVNFTPTNATDKGVTYSSTNTGVVNNSGVVVGVGTCTLTVTADDTTNGTLTDDMSVTVYASETPGLQIKSGAFYNINGGTYKAIVN